MLDEGAAKTSSMRFGDRGRMDAILPDGRVLFGSIDQKGVRAVRS